MPITGFAANGLLASPDYDQINLGNSVALVDALRLIWNTIQSEISDRKRQRLAWNDVPYSSALFTASAGTWTVTGGNVKAYQYVVENDFCIVQFNFASTTTSAGMGTELRLNLPIGLKAVQLDPYVGFAHVYNNIDELCYCTIQSGTSLNVLSLKRVGGTAWPSSVTGALGIQGSIVLRVQV